MSDHFKVWVSDPMADRGLGTREEIIKDSDFMAKEHKTINKMRPDKASTASDQNPLALRWGKESYGRETGESGV